MKFLFNRRGLLTGMIGLSAMAMGSVMNIPYAYAEGESVALIVTAKQGDEGPIDGLVAGMKTAEKKFGVKTRVIEALDPATFETTLRSLARRKTDVVMGTFFAMGAAVQKVAPDFPDTKFVVIVGAPLDPALPNVRVAGYKTQDNGHLSGIFAGHTSKAGKIGYLGGIPLPFAWAEYNAFAKAAKAINPDVNVSAAFVQSFGDPVKAREIGAGMFAKGIDTILTLSSASDIGTVEAAVETGNTILTASPELLKRGPKIIGFVASFEWEETLLTEIANALSGDAYQSGFRIGDVRSGEIAVSFPDSFNDAADADVKARLAAAKIDVEKAVAMMKSGNLVIPFDPTER